VEAEVVFSPLDGDAGETRRAEAIRKRVRVEGATAGA
jgi:hypothetical protein